MLQAKGREIQKIHQGTPSCIILIETAVHPRTVKNKGSGIENAENNSIKQNSEVLGREFETRGEIFYHQAQ